MFNNIPIYNCVQAIIYFNYEFIRCILLFPSKMFLSDDAEAMEEFDDLYATTHVNVVDHDFKTDIIALI